MERKVLFIVSLCMAFFTSCTKDENVMPEPGQLQTAKIELTLTGANAGTRAGGLSAPSDVATDEQKVNNIVIGIFNDENILSIQTVTNPSTASGNKNVIICQLSGVTSVTCSAVVVANVPSSGITALNGATTKSDFLAKTISLGDATTANASGTGSQISTNLPMSGDVKESASTTFTLTAGGTTTGLSVELTRMVSRVTLTSLRADFVNSAYPSAVFKLQRVFLRGAIGTTKVTTSATASVAMPGSPSYLTTGTWNSGTSEWTGSYSYLFDDLLETPVTITDDAAPNHPGNNYYWFYAFANDGSVSGATPTAFVIQGSFDPDGTGTAPEETVFYPVVVNRKQPGTTYDGDNTGTVTGSISRNQLYNLSVALKNKGVLSPADDINPANLEINVTVAPWPTAIEQNVDFD